MGALEIIEGRAAALDRLAQQVLERFQHDLPLTERPFAAIGEALGCAEAQVLATLARLTEQGIVSRVGPVFRPHRVGTSTLAAMQVPPERLEEVAALVNRRAEVNHNYEREHRFNLWFVATAADEAQLAAALAGIAADTTLPVMSLPMLDAYHLDLGFPLEREAPHRDEAGAWAARPTPNIEPLRRPLSIRDPGDLRLVAAVQDGLPLTARPYAAVARAAGLDEARVRRRLGEWLRDGTIGRLGVVVRHRELGYRANAMVVWDVPDAAVDALGHCFGRYAFVTLCYRRVRRPPHWPYNLFCMIHGRDRAAVEERVRHLVAECELAHIPHALLFSRRRFKQRGARYVVAPSVVEAACHG